MADLLVAPNFITSSVATRRIFLAGGISKCPAWQDVAVHALMEVPNLLIINPRRESFDVENPQMTAEQISWEHTCLGISDYIMFWFAPGTDNPITLYEYGRRGRLWMEPGSPMRDKIFVGADPEYSRNVDVRLQTMLDGGPRVYDDLIEMLYDVKTALLKNPY